MKIHQTELTIVRVSVLDQKVDAIVNAANTAMRGGGALDGAIHRAAGPEMRRELEQVAPHGATTGEVVVTGAYNLPQQFVFHVAGPIWNAGRAEQCDNLLAYSYRNCLEEAHNRGLESIGFPSLSTGVYSFPIDRASTIAVGVAIEFLNLNPQTSLRRVIFAMFGGTEHHYFEKALKNMPATLEDAIALAATHHKGQFDKAGQPYILHPLRVMANLGRTASEEQRIAAVLHDIVEDCEVSFQDLRDQGFSEEVVAAVDALTKRPNEKDDYMAAIRRVSQNEIARQVKMADLTDNLDLSRIPNPTSKDGVRLEKYQAALQLLRDFDK